MKSGERSPTGTTGSMKGQLNEWGMQLRPPQRSWRATERWLPRCGGGSQDWKERQAYLIQRPLLGGAASEEEITYPDDPESAVATFHRSDSTAEERVVQSYVYGRNKETPGCSAARNLNSGALRSLRGRNRHIRR